MKHDAQFTPLTPLRAGLFGASLLLAGCGSTDALYTGLPNMEDKPPSVEEQLSELKKRLDVHDQEWQQLKPGIERLLQLEGDLKNLTVQLDQIARAATTTAAQPAPAQPVSQPAAQTTQSAPPPTQRLPQTAPVAPPSTTGRYALHIASFREAATVEPGWKRLQSRYPALLQDRQVKVQGVDLGAKRGTYYRLKVGPFAEKAGANGLCNKLKTLGNDCVLTTFQGTPVGQTPTVTAATQPATSIAAPTGNAYALQLASYKNQQNLQRGWQELQQRFPDILKGKTVRTTSIALGERGTYYRLKAGPISDQSTAQQLCRRLIANQANCVVTRFDGQPLAQ